MANPPVLKLIDGQLQAAIWAKQGNYGMAYSVTLQKSYKDQQDQWQHTEFLASNELLTASQLLTRAHEAVRKMKIKDKAGDQHQDYRTRPAQSAPAKSTSEEPEFDDDVPF